MSSLLLPRRPAHGRPAIGRDITRRPPSMDPVQPPRQRRPLPATQVPITRPVASRPSISSSASSPKAGAVKKSKLPVGQLLQYPLIAGLALGAAYNATVGQIIVLGYAILALVLRRSSRLSFGVALFLLVTIPLFQALNQPDIAQNAAIYVYELLVVGTVQAIIELRKTDKTHNSSEI